MGQVIPFPRKKPEQEVIYFELQTECEPKSRIVIRSIGDNGPAESELIVFSLSD